MSSEVCSCRENGSILIHLLRSVVCVAIDPSAHVPKRKMEGVISGRCDHMCAARMLTPSRLAVVDAEIGLSATTRFSSTLLDSHSAVWHKINRNKTRRNSQPVTAPGPCMRKMIEWTFSKICVSSAVNKIAPFDSKIVKSTSKYGEMKRYSPKRERTKHTLFSAAIRFGDAWISLVDLFFTVAFYYRIDSPFYAYDCIRRIAIRCSLPFTYLFFRWFFFGFSDGEISVDRRRWWISFRRDRLVRNEIFLATFAAFLRFFH